MSSPINKSTLQECVGEKVISDNKENVTNNSNINYARNDLRKSYSDVCNVLTKKRLVDKSLYKRQLDHNVLNNTCTTVYNKHSALLVKLNNVANACTKRK